MAVQICPFYLIRTIESCGSVFLIRTGLGLLTFFEIPVNLIWNANLLKCKKYFYLPIQSF